VGAGAVDPAGQSHDRRPREYASTSWQKFIGRGRPENPESASNLTGKIPNSALRDLRRLGGWRGGLRLDQAPPNRIPDQAGGLVEVGLFYVPGPMGLRGVTADP